MSAPVVIRAFTASDAPLLVSLITELATYERMTQKLTVTPEKLVHWMLAPRPVAEGLIVETDGLLARALQHEIDHLNGVLFTDRLPAASKVAMKNRLKKLAQEFSEG